MPRRLLEQVGKQERQQRKQQQQAGQHHLPVHRRIVGDLPG